MGSRGIVFAGARSGGFHANSTIYSRGGDSGTFALAGLRGRTGEKRGVAKGPRTQHARTGASHDGYARRAEATDNDTRQSAHDDDENLVADNDDQSARQSAHRYIDERQRSDHASLDRWRGNQHVDNNTESDRGEA